MEKLKLLLAKYGKAVSALALMIGVASVNSACLAFYHQPKMPEAMNSYKK